MEFDSCCKQILTGEMWLTRAAVGVAPVGLISCRYKPDAESAGCSGDLQFSRLSSQKGRGDGVRNGVRVTYSNEVKPF